MGADGAEVTKIGIGSKVWSNKLRKATKELARKIDEAEFELGVLLWRIYDTPIDGKEENNPLYMGWGYKSFKEYAEEELGLQGRKAERLRLIGKVLEQDMKPLPKELKERFVQLGWSKAREVARIFQHQADEETVDTWLAFAENNNYPSTLHTVSKKMDAMDYDEDGNYVPPTTTTTAAVGSDESGDVAVLPEVDRTHMFNFFCLNEQIDTVREALERAQELAKAKGDPEKDYKKSNLLSLICLDFLATNQFGKKGDPKTLAFFAKRFEEFTGMKIVAFDKTDEGINIIHGVKNLEKLAEELSEDD